MELCSPSQRDYVGSLFLLPWTLGYMLVQLIAYLVRPWRWLQAALSLPLFYCVIMYWLVPESPRWLIKNGRYNEALTVLKQAAAVNRTSLPPDDALLKAITNINERERSVRTDGDGDGDHTVKDAVSSWIKHMFNLLLTPQVGLRAISISFIWAASASVYYGISLNSYNLSTNIYIYMFLGGLLEVPAYIFLWLAVTYLGRRKSLIFLYLLCGVSMSVLAALMFLYQVPEVAKLVLSLSCKMAITAAFHLIWFYTIELFSTEYRARATALANTVGRIGSATSPYVNDILGEVAVWGPSVVFSVTALVAAILVLTLPETSKKNLPQLNKKEPQPTATD